MDIPYYIELQRRMIDIFRYVSCHEDNFGTYSVVLESLLVDACSFFDSLCQTFIREKSQTGYTFKQESRDFKKKVEGKEGMFNCGDYRALLEDDFGLSKHELNLNRYDDSLCLNPMQSSPDQMSGYRIVPFRAWANNDLLPWWEAFTHLKHDRLTNYRAANLGNAIYSLAGAFVILALRNESEFKAGSVPPELYDLFFPKYWKSSGRLFPGTLKWSCQNLRTPERGSQHDSITLAIAR
jgi:hypothetical protein